jgi:hypothetical protein
MYLGDARRTLIVLAHLNGERYHIQHMYAAGMHVKMVEDVEGCNVGVKRLRIAKVANPRVVYNSLDKNLDAALSGLVSLVVLKQGGPGSFGANAVDARSFCGDCWIVTGQTGDWPYEGSTVMVEIAIHAGKEAPQVVDAVDAVIGCLEKDRRDGI